MSGGHFEYTLYYTIEDVIQKLKRDEIGYDSEPTDNDYRKSCEPRGKVPKWVWKILEEYQAILHDIDCDVSGDDTIKKGYFDKKKKKIMKILYSDIK